MFFTKMRNCLKFKNQYIFDNNVCFKPSNINFTIKDIDRLFVTSFDSPLIKFFHQSLLVDAFKKAWF